MYIDNFDILTLEKAKIVHLSHFSFNTIWRVPIRVWMYVTICDVPTLEKAQIVHLFHFYFTIRWHVPLRVLDNCMFWL